MFGEFVGVDGCRAGWIAVTLTPTGNLSHEVDGDIEALLARHPDALALIDMPIGLRDAGPAERLCDPLARRRLGPRRSSVFPVPAWAALFEKDWASASALNKGLTGRGLSKQSWGIAPGIREVNELLLRRPERRPVVREMHPELCFWGLKGRQTLPFYKMDEEGYRERVGLLESALPGSEAFVESVLAGNHRGFDRCDLVDAFGGAVTARLGRDRLETIPELPEIDSRGLPMEMVYFAR
jgi:predicted RNase H-like nuclease